MPDEHGIPTDEEIQKWRARWIGENAYRVDDVVRILQEDPHRGADWIVDLQWYTEKNGFDRWLPEEEEYDDLLEARPVLDLRGCNLYYKTQLVGAELPLTHFEGADLFATNLSRANLRKANFSGAALWGANLSKSRLQRAELRNVNLNDANLKGARLREAHFLQCDLTGVDLNGANIRGTSFLNCNLRETKLRSPKGYAECDAETFFGRTAGKRKEETSWLFDKSLLSERGHGLKDARNICSEIRLCFRDNGLFHNAAIYYEQEEYWRTRATWEEIGTWKGCLKKGNRWKSFLLLCRYILGERFMGYGEHPGYIVGWSSALIFLCAIVFFLCGFQYETAPRVFEPMSSSSFVFLSGEAWIYLSKCLRFSIENFVTLGFSKMQPAERWSHWVASLEGVAGVLFVALATVTWARKAIRD